MCAYEPTIEWEQTKCQMWKRGKVNLNMCVNKDEMCLTSPFYVWCNNICILVEERLLSFILLQQWSTHFVWFYIWMDQKRNTYMFNVHFSTYMCGDNVKVFALSSAFCNGWFCFGRQSLFRIPSESIDTNVQLNILVWIVEMLTMQLPERTLFWYKWLR